MVHQHFSLVEALTVWENVALGDVGQTRPAPRSATRGRDQRAVRARDRSRRPHQRPLGRHAPAGRDHQVPPPRPGDPRVRRADVGAVAGGGGSSCSTRCAAWSSDEGKAVALVSHKLAEVMAATDEITIMRDGRVVEAAPDRGRRRRHAGAGDGRPRGPCCAAHGDSHVRDAPPPATASLTDARAAVAAHRRRVAAAAATAECCSIGSRPRGASPARSSASPASRATASARSATCCRVCSRSTPGTVEVDGRRVPHRSRRRDGARRRRGDPRGSPRLRMRARLHRRREHLHRRSRAGSPATA